MCKTDLVSLGFLWAGKYSSSWPSLTLYFLLNIKMGDRNGSNILVGSSINSRFPSVYKNTLEWCQTLYVSEPIQRFCCGDGLCLSFFSIRTPVILINQFGKTHPLTGCGVPNMTAMWKLYGYDYSDSAAAWGLIIHLYV